MELTQQRPEGANRISFFIAHQVFRRAEYVCLWRLRGQEPIGAHESLDAIKACCLIDPTFLSEPLQTEWGELEPDMIDEIRKECLGVFDDPEMAMQFTTISDTMLTVASKRLIDVQELQVAQAVFARIQQPMLDRFLA